MTHLGADVTAFVDGQLPLEQADAARRHLRECSRCRTLVADQEQLKRRMARSCVPAGVPAHLAAALSAVATTPGDADGSHAERNERARTTLGVLTALLGSSAAVLMLAYLIAPPVPASGDPVRPDFESYASDFLAELASNRAPDLTVQGVTLMASTASDLTSDELDELAADGWPCHQVLAGDFTRLDGRFVESGSAIALRYDDGQVRLHLFEHAGSLDEAALDGFQRTTVAGSMVWVREGLPNVATWQADGVVYTVVTDASIGRLEDVVSDLPATPARSALERIGDGLDRMSGWVSAA